MNNLCKSCEHGGVCTDKHEGNSLPVKEEAVDVACSGSFPAKKNAWKKMPRDLHQFVSVRIV